MFCQNCGAVDDGGVRCSSCGANDYGPNMPELTQEQIQTQSSTVRSNKVQNVKSSSDGGFAVTFIVVLVIFGGMWIFGAFD